MTLKRQAIALTVAHPEIAAFMAEINQWHKDTVAQIEFLEKRAAKIAEDRDKGRLEIWSRLEDFCKTKGLLPAEYSKEKHAMSYDEKLGILAIHEKDDCGHPGHGPGHDHGSPGADLLKGLMRAMTVIRPDDHKKDT